MISSTIDLTTPADASESIYVDLVRYVLSSSISPETDIASLALSRRAARYRSSCTRRTSSRDAGATCESSDSSTKS